MVENTVCVFLDVGCETVDGSLFDYKSSEQLIVIIGVTAGMNHTIRNIQDSIHNIAQSRFTNFTLVTLLEHGTYS